MTVCAFIGLGNMGFPMAGHLVAAGHEVRVYNRTTSRADSWAALHEGIVASTPREAAAGAEIVLVCVGADDDVREVLVGDRGALAAMEAGSLVVDHTTTSADLALEMHAACSSREVGFVDGPISGGQAGAEAGTLSVMCGGEPDHFEQAAPVMEAYASAMTLVGPPGSGQLTKMVNQILCAGAIQGAAEALAFGLRAGLDMERVLAAVTRGAASSWYLLNRGETMIANEFDFGFAVDWMAKDLGLVLDQAQGLETAVPLSELTAGYLARAQQVGDNRLDATVIIRAYRGD